MLSTRGQQGLALAVVSLVSLGVVYVICFWCRRKRSEFSKYYISSIIHYFVMKILQSFTSAISLKAECLFMYFTVIRQDNHLYDPREPPVM